MQSPWQIAIAAGMSLLTPVTTSVARATAAEVTSVEELFARSGEAYRAGPALAITLTTLVEIPNAEPGKRIARYLLGKGTDASIDIVPLMRVVASGETLYVERIGADNRYFETPYAGDLGETLTSVRGKSILAGFWEPPQAALRAGKPTGDVIEAFRYSSLLGELELTGRDRLSDSTYEIRLQAANGTCTARFDPQTYHLVEVDYVVQPPGAPEDYAVEIKGRYETRALAPAAAVVGFDPGDRRRVETYGELAPRPPGISKPAEELLSADELTSRLLDLDGLAESVREKRVLLIGEDHLYNEPPAYLTALLDRLDDRLVSLHLELPHDSQSAIDLYVREGREETLSEIFDGRQVLQLQTALRWAHEHQPRILQVQAMDEPLYDILARRAYLEDTRNQTMAQALYRAWEDHPEGRVIAYAGQLHMMRAGRYRLNQPSRETAGSRLLGMGVPRDQLATILLNGGENFHLHAVWNEPGVLPIEGETARIPVPYFIDYPIFAATTAGELFDYYVNLGPLSRVEMDQ